MSLMSIVIPAYNEEESIEHVVTALRKVLQAENIRYEIIFIDDGSADNTFLRIKEQCESDENIRGYRFSRNFGKESAIWAGLKYATGDCCLVMDSDLQHPPETIPEMYRLWEEGYEVVEGIKANRGKESLISRMFTAAFYKLITGLSGFDMRNSSDFKLLDKRVVDELVQLEERNSFFRGLSHWVGFRSVKVEYEVMKRKYGKTKWNFISLTKYAIKNITGFSTAPLHLVTAIGFTLVIASIAFLIFTLIRHFYGHSLEGFATVIVLLLFIGGGLMISLGIIGVYIAKIYDEVKSRPRYIVSESTED